MFLHKLKDIGFLDLFFSWNEFKMRQVIIFTNAKRVKRFFDL